MWVFSTLKQKLSRFDLKWGSEASVLLEGERGTFRAVMLGKQIVMWLRSTVEELSRGTELKDFYRSVRSGSTIYVVQRHENGLWSYRSMA